MQYEQTWESGQSNNKLVYDLEASTDSSVVLT